MDQGSRVPKVDVVFRVKGEAVPLDSGYVLLGALATALGEDLHEAPWLAVYGFRGVVRSERELSLQHHQSELRLRVTHQRIPFVQKLAGKTLDVAGYRVLVGTSQAYELLPAKHLYSRIVTTKVHENITEADTFRKAIQERVRELGVKARVELGERRVVRIAGDVVVGYETHLYELSPEDSLAVLYEGIGGRRRFGCGVFQRKKQGA